MKSLYELFCVFCRIGGLTFGGGYAMLPMLQKEIVERYEWATEEELLDYYAVGQSTPGIIAVNTATFIGYKQKGIVGALCATLGVIFPSLVIIMSLSTVLDKIIGYEIVDSAFSGIRVVVSALILNSLIGLYKKSIATKFDFIVMAGVAGVSFLIDLSPVYIVIGGAIVGLIWDYKNSKNGDNNK